MTKEKPIEFDGEFVMGIEDRPQLVEITLSCSRVRDYPRGRRYKIYNARIVSLVPIEPCSDRHFQGRTRKVMEVQRLPI